MKTSRAPVHSPRISASVRLTCLPGRLPRTSKSLAMTSSTSVGPDAAVEEEAIHPRSERRPAARAEAAQVRLAAQGQQGTSEATEGCSDLLHGSWRTSTPQAGSTSAGATRASARALRSCAKSGPKKRERVARAAICFVSMDRGVLEYNVRGCSSAACSRRAYERRVLAAGWQVALAAGKFARLRTLDWTLVL